MSKAYEIWDWVKNRGNLSEGPSLETLERMINLGLLSSATGTEPVKALTEPAVDWFFRTQIQVGWETPRRVFDEIRVKGRGYDLGKLNVPSADLNSAVGILTAVGLLGTDGPTSTLPLANPLAAVIFYCKHCDALVENGSIIRDYSSTPKYDPVTYINSLSVSDARDLWRHLNTMFK